MPKTQSKISEFLESLDGINLDDEEICIVFSEVFQHDEALFSRDEIENIDELSPDALHEQLRYNADCIFYGATAGDCIKLVVTGSYEAVEIPIQDLIDDGIVSVEQYDINPASAEEPYVRLEETLAGSENWQFPIAAASSFDLSKLKITVFEYKVFNENQRVIGAVSYDNQEIGIEISDSGLNPVDIGMQAYARLNTGDISCIGEVFGDSFHDHALKVISKWQSL